jgi:hypothetical protein
MAPNRPRAPNGTLRPKKFWKHDLELCRQRIWARASVTRPAHRYLRLPRPSRIIPTGYGGIGLELADFVATRPSPAVPENFPTHVSRHETAPSHFGGYLSGIERCGRSPRGYHFVGSPYSTAVHRSMTQFRYHNLARARYNSSLAYSSGIGDIADEYVDDVIHRLPRLGSSVRIASPAPVFQAPKSRGTPRLSCFPDS